MEAIKLFFRQLREKIKPENDLAKKMPPNALKGHAEVGYNADFYVITTHSIGMLSYAEPEAPPIYLAPDCTDEALGDALRSAISASKRVSVKEFHEILSSGRIRQLADERNKAAMKKYGYRTKGAMWRKMKGCSVALIDEMMKIQPMHHKSLDRYSASKDGPQALSVPLSASDDELGACLRQAFDFCTSSVP